MRQYTDTVDPGLPPVRAEAVRYSMVLAQMMELVDTLDAHSGRLGEETQRSLAAAEAISGCCSEIRRLLEVLLLALDERKAEQAQVRDLLVEQTAVLGSLERRLPDPTKVRLEIQGDLWQMTRDDARENLKEMEETLHSVVREAAARFIEACTRGYIGPERPADGSPLRARLIFLRDLFIFHGRKFASAVTRLIGVAALVLLVAERIFHIPV
jgi:hypothetical protein